MRKFKAPAGRHGPTPAGVAHREKLSNPIMKGTLKMYCELLACQQYVGTIPRLASSAGAETWQLVAGLEGALILVLFVGWLHAIRGTSQKRDGVGDGSQ